MGDHYPHVRRYEAVAGKECLVARELLQIIFYLPFDNHDISMEVARALDVYRQGVGVSPQTICYAWDPGPDGEGGQTLLDEAGWRAVENWMRPSNDWRFLDEFSEDSYFFRSRTKYGYEFYISLTGAPDAHTGYEFKYIARVPWRSPSGEAVSRVVATVPTEFIDEHGPGRVRELALEMASHLRFVTGHAGLMVDFLRARRRQLATVKEDLLRYPGLDVPSLGQWLMGSRVDGVHWLNFLGPPVLRGLGGIEALQFRLHSPKTRVRDLGGERAVVTLGPWPEAGDLSRGDNLPAYRELARVLEPWLDRFSPSDAYGWKEYTEDEVRRWWRRFLD